MHWLSVKENLKKEIMLALNKGKPIPRRRLLAQLRLDTGLTEKLINTMLSDLQAVGYLEMDDEFISVKKKKRR